MWNFSALVFFLNFVTVDIKVKISQEDIVLLRAKILEYLENVANFMDGKPKSVDIVETGWGAWELLHRSGGYKFLSERYPEVKDAHIQTALKRIFPQAVFLT
jgi:hypothetical protein